MSTEEDFSIGLSEALSWLDRERHEVIGEFDAVLRQAAGKCVPLDVERMAKMIDARQQRGAEDFAIGHDAAYRHAAEIHAVIALFAADQACAVALTASAVISNGDFQRRVDRL